MSLPRIGSQLFINRGDSPEQAREWVDQMNTVGLRVIRLFMLWDLVESREGHWTWDVFDAVFDQAAKNDMGVVPTLWALTSPGWMRRVRSLQGIDDLTDKKFTDRAMDYVDRCVLRYANHPGLDSWIIWNEASLELVPEKKWQTQYRDFLSSYHGSIEEYNRLSYHQFESFDEVQIHEGELNDFWAPHIEQLDWARFNRSQLLYWMKVITERIRSNDPNHPIHVNPHALVSNYTKTGQEVWEEGKVVDFLGCSAHPVWHFTRFERKAWPQAIAMSTILMRSASKGQQFWLSELQAGPAIDSGLIYDTPTGDDFRVWLWTGIGTGADALVFWCFNDRNDGAEAGEWRLMGPAGGETKRSKVTTEVCEKLIQHNEWFENSQAKTPCAHILHSTPSRTFAYLAEEGPVENPRSQDSADDALCGAWTLLDDLGIEAGFVNEAKVKSLDPKQSPLLICPNVTCVEDKSLIAELHQYVEHGGTLIVDGAFASKDQNGWMLREQVFELEKLIGAKKTDQTCFREKTLIQGQNSYYEAFFMRNDFVPTEGTQVFATWEDGDPAGLCHSFGQGRVITIGTCFFQKYFVNQDPALLKEMLIMLDMDDLLPSLSFANQNLRSLRHSVLDSKKGDLHMFINDFSQRDVKLMVHVDGIVEFMDTEELKSVAKGEVFNVSLPSKGVLLLGFKENELV
ncbi:beta-galactosidase [Lentisphaera marina]|uniref:beta-galactosidase n=1 Tax=Lentisphaera marina TaxID=1111041 RepID=UPI002365B3A3|nr:beta-galactosidase [Lentisphaera marina]MDD7986144.1 beta-galactosidase [Lentisphaera marina]